VADNYQTFTYGKVSLQILTGDQDWGDEINDYFGGLAVWIPGILNSCFMAMRKHRVEQNSDGKPGAEILKVGHHAAVQSSSPEFLKQVNPKAAVICCGGPAILTDTRTQETWTTLGKIGAAGLP
jgi:hypothetical protein